MKILVTGSRSGDNAALVDYWLAKLGPSMIIEGGANGYDKLSRLWGWKRGIHVATVSALWDFYGNAAGPIRNQAQIQLLPHVCLSFPGNRGTTDMTERARAAGVRVIEAA